MIGANKPSTGRRPKARHRWIFALLSTGIGILVPLLMAEIALRFLPVHDGINAAAVNAETPVFRFLPNRDFVWSRDWDLALSNRGRINNAGFVNDQDYETDSDTPVTAVIGDSYVEAVMVPYGQTLHGRLAAEAGGRGRVYSFGASGAPLSQYLIWAEHANRTYGADAMVFVVVGNDFDESLAEYKTGPGFHHYVTREDGELELRRYDYRPKPWVRYLLNFALVRYAVYQLRVQDQLRRMFDIRARAGELEFVGNTPAAASADRLRNSRRAVDAFLRDLRTRSSLPPERILLVVDGARYPIDDPSRRAARDASYFVQMRRYLLERAQTFGYGAIDMDPIFFAHWRAHQQRFDYPPRDGHWNSLAHGLAAQAVMRSPLFMDMFGRQ